jgi:hypothetical protein
MNIQFFTQQLREEVDEFDSLRSMLSQLGAEKDTVEMLVNAVAKGHLQPSKAVEIVKSTTMNEDGAAAAPAGGSTTGGGVTNGATFTPGTGEQYAGKKKKYQEDASQGKLNIGDKVKYENQDWEVVKLFPEQGTVRLKHLKGLPSTTALMSKVQKSEVSEDAPRLAGSPAKTNKQGAKNIHTYTQDGFTKAPSAKEAGKHIEGVQVKELWEESRQYSQFKRETATRSKPDQMHEAAKIIQNKLHEIEKLLEFTSQMRSELSEGEQTLEYKHNTKKVFEKIHSKVVEVYTKVKGLK